MTEKFEVIFYGDVINCVRDETGREYNLHETITILNEQQATIRKLQDLCGKSDGENMKLRIENKRLEKEVNLLRPTNIEQYEQIQKLQEENEQLRKQVAEYGMILRQHEFAEKEGFSMNEKRFFTKINKNGRLVIIDKECHIELIDLTLACEVLNRLDLKLKTYNEQLGEQQATIRKLQDLCGESDGENAKLRIENKRLQEENEQLSKQMNRLYNYFQDWSENIMAGEHFSEMWDIVKEDESWDDE